MATKRISFRIDEDQDKIIRGIADFKGISLTDFYIKGAMELIEKEFDKELIKLADERLAQSTETISEDEMELFINDL